ncbi:MAG: TraB/GumN family protein, partial [Sphingomonas sp.]
GMSWFDDAVKKAFDKSDTLVLEIVQPPAAEMQQLVTAKGIASDGIALTARLPEKERAGFAAGLAGIGAPPAAFDTLKPWLAATLLTVQSLQKLGYDPSSGPEHVLTEAANTEHKPVIGLETAAQQLGFFDSLSQPAQITFLSNTIDELPKLKGSIEDMVGDWAKGDPVALAKVLNDDLDDSPEVTKVLLTDRNARWADWIDARMKQPGTVFIAVGAGHLAGDQSVIAMLRKHHLKAKRIKY